MFIGITQRLVENSSYYEIREALSIEWGDLFVKNTALKPFLPLPLSYEIPFNRYIKAINGVILSGGNDLNSLNPNTISQKRDTYENTVIQQCIQHKIPLLGICRGAQIIASYFNATLQPCNKHVGEHSITLQNRDFRVNSYHNYSILELKGELEVLATATQDSSIEAFYHRKLPIFAMLWHIERERDISHPSLFILEKWLQNIKNHNKN